MALTEAQEQRMIGERAARNKQDKTHPHLIHIDDGRLMPNVPNLLKHPKYRPYHGDPKASADERMKYLASQSGYSKGKRAVVNTELPEEPAFDIGLATKEELVKFAKDEYATVLAPETDIRTLKKQVAALAAKLD